MISISPEDTAVRQCHFFYVIIFIGCDNVIILIESVVLCIVFTVMVYIISREPIKTLYNYPPRIQERVKILNEYKNLIPSRENKIVTKIFASIIFLIIICVILRYINGYKTFLESFGYKFLLWTVLRLMNSIQHTTVCGERK